jgi:hypothetical protein
MHANEMSYKSTNLNSTPTTQLPHKISYIVAILIYDNHFESPNTLSTTIPKKLSQKFTELENQLSHSIQRSKKTMN